ncbi:HEAT repeat domain-containing protein [Coleofasciculus sp.]|uniref:HEAT repeat domain-containing protein n=1 Tax=Coleofasciculus sp. TaxID=3100458 RepID=UPI003A3BDFFE
MKKLIRLLNQAEQHLDNLRDYRGSDHRQVREEIQKFFTVENQIRALSNVRNRLEKIALSSFESNLSRYSQMACLILARSGWPGSASIVLKGACQSTGAIMPLLHLAPSSETISALETEIARQQEKDSPEIAVYALVEALTRQRSAEVIPTVLSYIQGNSDWWGCASILSQLVTLMPEPGLLVAQEIEQQSQGTLSLTALGLRAVYQSQDAYEHLLSQVGKNNAEEETIYFWLGNIPRQESLDRLLPALNHPSEDIRLKVLTSLSLFGDRQVYRHIIPLLSDASIDVVEQATGTLWDWLDEDLQEFEKSCKFKTEVSLMSESQSEFEKIARARLETMEPNRRYCGKQLYLPIRHLHQIESGILPRYHWYQWVATTGIYKPFREWGDLLDNFTALDELIGWYQQNAAQFEVGYYYYHGRKCSARL